MPGKRASTTRAAFQRVQAPTPAAQRSSQDRRSGSKYTVLLGDDDALLWDQLAVRLRRDTGHRVDKSAIVRTLVYLAAEDAALYEQLTTQLRRDGTP